MTINTTSWLPRLDNRPGPKYLALALALAEAVEAGELPPGARLPTHRDLADALRVTVGTVTRAYAEAQRRGLVTGTVGRGTFVAQAVAADPSMSAGQPLAPGTVELALVTPPPAEPDLSEALRRLARQPGIDRLMRYHALPGLPRHRAAGAAWAQRCGLSPRPEDVLVCTGAQHALTVTLLGLLRPGQRIACDTLTYPGLKTLASQLGLILTAVPGDTGEDGNGGMRPDALDTACRRDEIAALYLMPGVHNPTAGHLPPERRAALAEVARRRGLIIIEDDVYGLTRTGPPTPPLASFAPERTVFVAGLSKVLSAGLRICFLVTPEGWRRPLSQALFNTVWMAPPLMAELAAMWIEDGTADRIRAQRLAESARRNTLARELLGPLTAQGHDTAYFRWLRLPPGWTGAAFEAAAREAGVNVFAAEKFAVGHDPVPPAARIALSAPETADDLARGLTTIRNLLLGPSADTRPDRQAMPVF